MERRRKSSTVQLKRYSASACSVTLILMTIATSLYFGINPFPKLVFGCFRLWYPIVSFIFTGAAVFISYVFYAHRLHYMNTVFHLCIILLIVETLFGFSIMVSFIVRLDKRLSTLTKPRKDADYWLIQLLQKKFTCNSTDVTSPSNITNTSEKIIDSPPGNITTQILSENCISTVKIHARDIAVHLITGYLSNIVLLSSLILIILFFYKSTI